MDSVGHINIAFGWAWMRYGQELCMEIRRLPQL